MSEHERKNLTFNPQVLELADELMSLRHFSDLSGFLSQLVREEHERRHGPVSFAAERPSPPPAPPDTVHPTKYPAPSGPRPPGYIQKRGHNPNRRRARKTDSGSAKGKSGKLPPLGKG